MMSIQRSVNDLEGSDTILDNDDDAIEDSLSNAIQGRLGSWTNFEKFWSEKGQKTGPK